MTDLTKLTIAEAREGLRKKEFTAPELTEAYIKKMDAGRENFNQITGLCIRNFRHTVYFAVAGYFGTVAAGAGTGDDNSPANSA